MNKFIIYFFVFFVFFVSYSTADCVQNDFWFYECVKEKHISVDELNWNTLDLDQIVLNLSEMNIDQPKECKTDFCYEESSVIVTVKKTWKPLTSVVNDENLKSWDFANKFDNIKETDLVNNRSSVYDRVVLQKVLHDRWILESKPTGKIGYLTELAVMQLQCIKWYSEYNSSKAIFEIWPRTIYEINNLKDRMKDENYLSSTSLPQFNLYDCDQSFISRYNAIKSLLKSPPSWANNEYKNMITPDTTLNWEWEVIIKKSN